MLKHFDKWTAIFREAQDAGVNDANLFVCMVGTLCVLTVWLSLAALGSQLG